MGEIIHNLGVEQPSQAEHKNEEAIKERSNDTFTTQTYTSTAYYYYRFI